MQLTAQQTQIAAALALLALGYFVGRRIKAQTSAGPAAHNDTANAPQEWWSYAGSWAA